MPRFVITPALPYFAATFDCDWDAARRVAGRHYSGAELDAHLAAINEAEAEAEREAAQQADYDRKSGLP